MIITRTSTSYSHSFARATSYVTCQVNTTLLTTKPPHHPQSPISLASDLPPFWLYYYIISFLERERHSRERERGRGDLRSYHNHTHTRNPKKEAIPSKIMWRRLISSHLQTLTPSRSASNLTRFAANTNRRLNSSPPTSIHRVSSLLPRHFSSGAAENVVKKRVEDVVPIATGHEREEIEADLQGKDILEINYPAGPFGTKDAPAIVKSVFDKRIVGCPGGEGEDEHDVVWFWLEKGVPHECPVCSQYFELEVVGSGGPPDGHGDEDHH